VIKVDNQFMICPASTGSKISPQNSSKGKKLGGRSTARKRTNNQRRMRKTPTDGVPLYEPFFRKRQWLYKQF